MRYIVSTIIFLTFHTYAVAQYFDHPLHYPGIIQTTQVCHGDFDKNGLLDFVLVSWGNSYLTVNYQISKGVYESKQILGGETLPGPIQSMFVEVGDLNHDGQDDIVAFSNYRFSRKKLFVLLSEGLTFKPPIVYEVNNCLWSANITISDFNKDQHPDLLIGVLTQTNELIGFKGNGDGTFQPLTVPFVYGSTRLIKAADFNQDGHVDFVAQNASSDEIYLYYGNSNLEFFYHTTLKLSGPSPMGLVCADFNQDNYPEIIGSYGGNNNAFDYFANNRNGTYTRKDILIPANRFISGLSLQSFDLHNDNKMDFIIADFGNMSSVGVQVFENAGGHTFNRTSYAIPRNGQIQHLRISPVENGFEAIFLPTVYEVMTYQMTNLTDVHMTYKNPTGLVLWDVSLKDLNNDGYKDIVGANSANHTISVEYNNGNRSFTKPVYFYTIDPPYDVEVSDINKDGFNDIIYCSYDQINLSPEKDLGILFGDATGSFSNRQTYPYSGYALALADFNKDGSTDILTGNALLLSNTPGNFTYNYFPTPGEFRSATAADLDQDGNQDVILVGRWQGLRISFGNGSGSFLTHLDYPINASGLDDLQVVDTNKDQLPEIYVSNLLEYGIPQFINQGNRTFIKKIINSSEKVSSIVFDDFNKDGFPDIAAAIHHSSKHQLLNGNSQHDFSPSTIFGLWISSLKLKLDELDNDGNLDIFSVNNSAHYSIMYGRTSDPGPQIADPAVFYPCDVDPDPNPDPDPDPDPNPDPDPDPNPNPDPDPDPDPGPDPNPNPEPDPDPDPGPDSNPIPEPEPCAPHCRCDIFFPNIITPNGDGKNETFRGSWEEAAYIADARINIYNRWGQLIITTGIEGWNATNAPSGIYFWTCIFTCKQNGIESIYNKRGIITVAP